MELTKAEFLKLLCDTVRGDLGFCYVVVNTCLATVSHDEAQRIVEEIYYSSYCPETVYTATSVSNPATYKWFLDIDKLCDFLAQESLVQLKRGISRVQVVQALASHEPLCGYYITSTKPRSC